MTAAHEQRISERRRLRLQSLCTEFGKRKKLRDNPKRQQQWDEITKAVQTVGTSFLAEDCMESSVRINGLHETAETMADDWRDDCRAVGIGVGFWSFLFWRFFLPLLIQLAKEWLQEDQVDESTVVLAGVASGEAVG